MATLFYDGQTEDATACFLTGAAQRGIVAAVLWQRSAKRRKTMKLSLLSFNIAKDMELPKMLSAAKAKGFEGVEFRADANHKHGVELDRTLAERKAIRHCCEDMGIAIACVGTGTRYESPDEKVRRENIDRAKRFVELAHDLGCGRIRVFGNAFPKGVEKADVVKWVGEALRELGEFAEKTSVDVLLEMHGDFYYWEYCLKAVQLANHPKIGIIPNCDPREVKTGGVRQSYEAVKTYVRHVHMHELDEPSYPYKEFFGLLKRDGYKGYLSAEIKESADPERVMGLYAALFRELV
ncbi:MAG: sugar phosphate isomerase/epimerase, partial [Planctomycetes bacterium]|nr:sugar phosphate isomerase/epimerase [Planctomycetota bacterium]